MAQTMVPDQETVPVKEYLMVVGTAISFIIVALPLEFEIMYILLGRRNGGPFL